MMPQRRLSRPRLAALLVVLASAVTAASGPAALDAEMTKVRGEVSWFIRRAITGEVYEHTRYISDRIGARMAGTPQAQRAVEWTTAQLDSWGYATRNEASLQRTWERGVERAEIVVPAAQRLVVVALGNSVSTPPGGLEADVVEVRSFEELAALGEAKVRGKIVLYGAPLDREMVAAGRALDSYAVVARQRSEGAYHAVKYGAVAVLVRSIASSRLRIAHTGWMRNMPGHPHIPGAALAVEDAELLHRLLASGERVRVRLELTTRHPAMVPSANVVAEMRGRERPEEIVLVCGHLDSWDLGTGATDNAAGVAMVLETMRLLADRGVAPRRTVRAVLFMGEELTICGASDYMAAHAQDKHVAAVEADSGAARLVAFATTLPKERWPRLEMALAPLREIGWEGFSSASSTGTDTSMLVQRGVPGFGLRADTRHYFDWHHSAADTLDKVVPTELAGDAAAVAALVWTLAELPDVP